jgi:hypothetical protein
MKLSMNMTLALACILAFGCQETAKKEPNKELLNSRLINIYNDVALENAIITQHTLYPYHFVKDGAELNDLGKRDLSVLINHFIHQAGHLNIRRLDISDSLYEARIGYVRKTLQDAGIETDRISISDGMPGGSGMSSESILVILSQEDNLSADKNQVSK